MKIIRFFLEEEEKHTPEIAKSLLTNRKENVIFLTIQ